MTGKENMTMDKDTKPPQRVWLQWPEERTYSHHRVSDSDPCYVRFGWGNQEQSRLLVENYELQRRAEAAEAERNALLHVDGSLNERAFEIMRLRYVIAQLDIELGALGAQLNALQKGHPASEHPGDDNEWVLVCDGNGWDVVTQLYVITNDHSTSLRWWPLPDPGAAAEVTAK